MSARALHESPPATEMVIAGTPLSVSEGLIRLLAQPPLRALTAEAQGRLELVLAEVLNNIVEHAYAGTVGDISIRLVRTACGIDCCIRDAGRPMPDLCPPHGGLIAWEADAPPEGGFGWHLIHLLTEGLHYRRAGAQNELRFHLPDAGLPG